VKVLGYTFYRAPAQETGKVKSKWTPVASDADLYTKVRPEGSFDIVDGASNLVRVIDGTGRLQPLPVDLLTNYDQIAPVFRDEPLFRTPDGGILSVPYAFITGRLGYDAEQVAAPNSLDDLAKPEYRNKVSLSSSPSTLLYVANSLGIDTRTLTKDQLQECTDQLERIKSAVKAFVSFGQEVALFKQREIAVHFPAYEVNNVEIRKTNPKLETVDWMVATLVDAWSVTSDANLPASLQWIDHFMSVPALKATGKVSFTQPTVPAAFDSVPEAIREDPASITTAQFATYPPPEASGDLATFDDYNAALERVKASLSS
jgi:spermidine/putrescine-binding protein